MLNLLNLQRANHHVVKRNNQILVSINGRLEHSKRPFFLATMLNVKAFYHIEIMNSAISQQGLEMLLAQLESAIPVEKVVSSLAKIKMNAADKSALYHGILEILTEFGENPKSSALAIVEGVEAILSSKAIQAQENILEAQNATEAAPNGPSKQSPIFRRVG